MICVKWETRVYIVHGSGFGWPFSILHPPSSILDHSTATVCIYACMMWMAGGWRVEVGGRILGNRVPIALILIKRNAVRTVLEATKSGLNFTARNCYSLHPCARGVLTRVWQCAHDDHYQILIQCNTICSTCLYSSIFICSLFLVETMNIFNVSGGSGIQH